MTKLADLIRAEDALRYWYRIKTYGYSVDNEICYWRNRIENLKEFQ